MHLRPQFPRRKLAGPDCLLVSARARVCCVSGNQCLSAAERTRSSSLIFIALEFRLSHHRCHPYCRIKFYIFADVICDFRAVCSRVASPKYELRKHSALAVCGGGASSGATAAATTTSPLSSSLLSSSVPELSAAAAAVAAAAATAASCETGDKLGES